MIIELHRVEKGLSFKNVKRNFGQRSIKKLVTLTYSYYFLKKQDPIYSSIYSCLKEYFVHSAIDDINFKKFLKKFISSSIFLDHQTENGGTKIIDIFDRHNDTLINLISSRVSCRDFVNKSIPKKVFKYVEAYQNHIPTVCNRQPCSFLVIPKDMQKKILDLQKGGIGFAEHNPTIIVILCDLRFFASGNERNQCFFEMGTFAYNLSLLFQNQGVSSCYLNWCTTPAVDLKAKKLLRIGNNFKIGTLMAIGYRSKKLKTAYSSRSIK
jgi:hypothetical protein